MQVEVKRGWAVVVAAGRGQRLGLAYNKVFLPIGGRSVLMRCLDRLASIDEIEGIVLVISREDEARYGELVRREGRCEKVRSVVHGGETRQQSVRAGLKALPPECAIVAIHDAARAQVPASVVRGTIDLARATGSGVAATMVKDTIKVVDPSGRAIKTPARETLRAVQTPQTFDRSIIDLAHERAVADDYTATDDAALVEHYVGPVSLFVSDDGYKNRKLTTSEDVTDMEKGMSRVKIGQGIDAHRLLSGRALVLCGVQIPHEMGLGGHSDADVAVHALMDALLGAAGLRDIGHHFPDSDDRYKGISSIALLEQVTGMLAGAGWRIGNCDVTIVAERPRLAPFMDEMRENLARAMGAPPDVVNVKATTTEQMGYEGRREGISAQAVALICAIDN